MNLAVSLDLPTLLIVSAVIITLTGILFIVDALSRQEDPVGRIWSLSYIAGVITTFSYLASSIDPALWWTIGLGNGAVVFSLACVWSGARRFNGRSSLLRIGAIVTVVVAAIALIQGPDGGEWAGGDAMIAGMFVFGILSGIECFRNPMLSYRNGRFLAGITTLAGAYYGVRLIFYYALGPFSDVFKAVLGTSMTTLVDIVLVTGGAFAMVALRGEESRYLYTRGGSHRPQSAEVDQFESIAELVLVFSKREGRSISVIVADIDELRDLNAAFGRSYGDRVLARFSELLREMMPAGTAIGRVGEKRFNAMIDGGLDDAVRLAEQVRSALVDTPLVGDDVGLRVTASFGLATTAEVGYDVAALRAAATEALTSAKSAGGNRVTVSS